VHRTRQSVDRYHRELGYWKDRRTPEQIAEDTAAANARTETAIAELRAQPVNVRIEHPVIEHPRWNTQYQVKRRVVTRDGLDLEIIGETRRLLDALVIANREQWAAIVIDSHGKAVHCNFQPELHRA
jgi:hypothetical protein